MSRLTPESEAVFSEALPADPLRAPDASLPVRLLIVDDDESMRKLMSSVLAGAGVESKSASSGHEALRILEDEQFDAVISDLAMPGMTGIELLNEVRRSHPRTAFLIVSGAGDIRIGVQAMREGCDDYIVKPFQIDAVMAAVERALRKRGLEQEVERYRLHLEEIVVERTLQLRTALNGIERSYEDTLGALGAAIDLRDNETGDHSRSLPLFDRDRQSNVRSEKRCWHHCSRRVASRHRETCNSRWNPLEARPAYARGAPDDANPCEYRIRSRQSYFFSGGSG
jgi:FixJ family two-component response regulator